MRSRYATLCAALLVSPAAWAQEAVDAADSVRAQEPVELAAPVSGVDAMFNEIVTEAQQIDRLLNGVTDKESAERSVVELEKMLTHMDEQLRALESFPFHSEQDAEALKSHMATLTHISQRYLFTMQRLVEVNAYGSDALLALFVRYKIDGAKLTLLRAEDMPHTQLYSELADLLEDVIYLLNNVQDAAGATAVQPRLRALLSEMSYAHNMLVQLGPPTTNEQKEAVRPARERLQKISGELKKAIDKLQAAQCYGSKELDNLLPQLLQASAG